MRKIKLNRKSVTHKKIVRGYYSKRTRDYDRQKARTWKSEAGFEAITLKEMIKAVQKTGSGLALEVGVGCGRISLPLIKETRLHIVGFDMSKDMLNLAKKKTDSHNKRFNSLLGDLEFLPFCDDSFSSLACVSTLHYLSSPRHAFSEFSRVLKKDGFFIYGDVTIHEMDMDGFLDKFEKTISPAHGKYCKPSEIEKLMEECRIHMIKTKTIPYRKPYGSLIEDKAIYCGVTPQVVYNFVMKATKKQKALYKMNEDEMTLFYTTISGLKTG